MRHRSQEAENMYLEWRLSRMELEQSKMAAATYRDMLVSNKTTPVSHTMHQGPSLAGGPAVSVLASQHAVPKPTPQATITPAVNLGPIVAQLEAIMAALTAAGIMNNQH